MKKCDECGKEFEGENCPDCTNPTEENENPASIPAPDPADESGEISDEPETPAPTLKINSGDPLAGILDEVFSSLPKSEPHVVQQLRQEENSKAKEALRWRKMRDKKGYYFDPEFCKTNADGSPVFTKTGLFDLKRGAKRTELKKRLVLPDETPQDIAEEITGEGPDEMPEDISATIKRQKAKASATTIDSLYWLLTFPIVPAEVRNPYQKSISPMAVELMTQNFMEMENPPELDWKLELAALYGSATIGMMQHEKVKPKVAPFFKKMKTAVHYFWLKITRRG